MKTSTLFYALALAGGAVASLPPQVDRLRNILASAGESSHDGGFKSRAEQIVPRAVTGALKSKSKFKPSDFLVNSSSLPLITFPLQNSYAGRLPISSKRNEKRVSYRPISQISLGLNTVLETIVLVLA
jgi:carboxypeptidase D